jgi:hypothetical protein
MMGLFYYLGFDYAYTRSAGTVGSGVTVPGLLVYFIEFTLQAQDN